MGWKEKIRGDGVEREDRVGDGVEREDRVGDGVEKEDRMEREDRVGDGVGMSKNENFEWKEWEEGRRLSGKK